MTMADLIDYWTLWIEVRPHSTHAGFVMVALMIRYEMLRRRTSYICHFPGFKERKFCLTKTKQTNLQYD